MSTAFSRQLVDEQATLRLFESFSEIVRDHLRTPTPGRGRIYELLNALASTAALVIAGTGSPEVEPWFQQALQSKIDDLTWL